MLNPKMKSSSRRILLTTATAFALVGPSAILVANASQSGTQPQSQHEITVTRVAAVPFETVIVEDESLPRDVEILKQEGVDGLKHVYGDRGYDDRVAPTLQEVVVQAPVSRIIHRGIKFEMPVVVEPEAVPEPEPEVVEAETPTEDAASRSEVASAPIDYSGEYSLNDLMFQGIINWGGYKFTYYSQSVLPGGGLSIPGRHVNGGGFVADGDGYIVLAGSAPMGTVYSTPFGAPGKIYDRGTVGNHLDVYTR